MFLSQLVMNERNRKVQKDLGNAHKFHQRIMLAFPDEESCDHPRENWHILFRQEPDSDVVLVQSEIEPDWSKLPESYLQKHEVKAFNPTVDRLISHGLFRFRLRANPSKRDSQTKKTVGFYRRQDQLAWLERQAERCGFRLHGVDVVPSPNVFGLKRKGVSPIRITTALFQGILEVQDAEKFIDVLGQGIGRGKSYGCGLLSIQRLQS